MRPRWVCLLLSLLTGCGSADEPSQQVIAAQGGGGGAGGEVGAGQGGEGGAPVGGASGSPAVASPALPQLTPCPPGWVEQRDGDLALCEPGPLPSWSCPEGSRLITALEGTPLAYQVCTPGPPPSWACAPGFVARKALEGQPGEHAICEPSPLPDDCPDGTMPVVGEASCMPIGDPCPEAGFPVGLPTDKPVSYVRAGAAAGGDGSKAKPFSTIAAAVKAAPVGGVVAIASGDYAEAITVISGRDVTLWGSCALGVRIAGPAASAPAATLFAQGSFTKKAKLTLKNLTVSGDRIGVLGQRADVSLAGVIVRQARTVGVGSSGSTLSLDRVLVVSTRADAAGNGGYGLDAEGASLVTVRDSLFEDNRQVAVYGKDTSTRIDLANVIIRATRSRPSDGTFGRGMGAESGASIVGARVLVDDNREEGVYVVGEGSSLELSDTHIAATRGQESGGLLGRGVSIEASAKAKLTRVVVSDNRRQGLMVTGGATLEAEGLAVLSTGIDEAAGDFGQGLLCDAGGVATVRGALFANNTVVGAIVLGAGSRLSLSQAVVSATQPQPGSGRLGAGLGVEAAGSLEATSVTISDSRDAAVYASGAGSKLTLSDCAMVHTLGRVADKGNGLALSVESGASAAGQRLYLDDNRGAGVLVREGGASADIGDIVVHATRDAENGEGAGWGLGVLSGGRLVLSRALVERNQEIGVAAAGEGAALELSDVVVRETLAGEHRGLFGRGLEAEDGAVVSGSRLLFDGNREMGVVSWTASAELSDVVVRDMRAANGGPGWGGAAVYGGRLALRRARFEGCREVGLVSTFEGASIDAHDLVVRGTTANDELGEHGMGVVAALGSSVSLERARITNNRVAALLLLQTSKASLTDCLLGQTEGGHFRPVDATGIETGQSITGVGDGLVALEGSTVEATSLLASGTTRAGLVFSESSGKLSRVWSTGNKLGLVLRRGAAPAYDDSCSFDGNETAIAPGDELPVPNAPLKVPGEAQ